MSLTKDKKLDLPNEFFGEKTIIISKSGYGKSYTARVIIEEGLKTGHTFIVVDPQEAYLNLEGFAYIEADKVKSANGLGLLLSQTHKNIVINTKRLSIEDQNKFLFAFLSSFRKYIRKGLQTIIIDEAHKFVPEMEKTLSKDTIRGMFQENRSDGLGIIAVTQRIARIDKTIISQADNMAIGRVTSHIDKKVVSEYLDNADDINKICVLEKGTFYLQGFGLGSPEIKSIRKAETEHSGNSPQNLLIEDNILFYNDVNKYVRNDGLKDGFENKNKTEGNSMSGDIVNNVIPSVKTFKDLAFDGGKIALGLGLSYFVSGYVGRMFKSPLEPYVSSRTLASLGTTIVLYTAHKMTPARMGTLKDVTYYATAGSAVYTVGSFAFDLLNAFNIQLPSWANTGIGAVTGVKNEGGTEGDAGVDVNTQFA